jgi:copper transport protein
VTTRYDQLLVLRLCVLALAVPVLRRLPDPRTAPKPWELAGFAALSIVSFSLAGHSGRGSWVPSAATLDAVHLAVASIHSRSWPPPCAVGRARQWPR